MKKRYREMPTRNCLGPAHIATQQRSAGDAAKGMKLFPIYYASPSSRDAYSDRKLTSNF